MKGCNRRTYGILLIQYPNYLTVAYSQKERGFFLLPPEDIEVLATTDSSICGIQPYVLQGCYRNIRNDDYANDDFRMGR